ncbi:unnamed protein product [Polarella glacialis]|uniref:Uncharacterized protein n=1 Tax=Polarella glacialis TaxID=89957 RepID=A0A813FL74_POLGL|nr:unnamed protein product [Polarella glacialis]
MDGEASEEHVRGAPEGLQGAESFEDRDAKDKATLAELAEKVVQLTKVIVFLHTRSDGHEARCAALRASGSAEVQQVAAATLVRVEEQRKHTASAAERRELHLVKLERRYAERVQQAQQAAAELRESVRLREEAAKAAAAKAHASQEAQLAEVKGRAERVRCELGAAEARARSDHQWLSRQLQAEASRQRQQMDGEFETASALLRSEYAVRAEQIKSQREAAVSGLRAEHAERREEAVAEANREHAATVEQQELGFKAERRQLEEQVEQENAVLAEARAKAANAKEECAEHQHQLDEMSRELQERKRQGQVLTQESDKACYRKLRAEAEARELRRRKVAMERTLGSPSAAANNGGAAPEAAERAVVTVSEDLRTAQARLEALRNELGQKQRMLQERRSALVEREQQTKKLAKELQEERRRSDQLQRVLLRLE